MKKRYSLAFLTSILLFTVSFISCTTSDNWNQFRGPESNMVINNAGLPEVWDSVTNIAWTYPIECNSWSSPVIWKNKVFILSAVPEKVQEEPPMSPPPGENNPETKNSWTSEIYRWEVICIDSESGNELWKKVAFKGNPRVKKHAGNSYASETPVTDGKRLYAYFGMTGVFCYDMKGNLLWEKDLGAFETLRGWGTGSSPVLYDGNIYIQVDNEEQSFIVAIDGANGEEIWRVGRDEKTNYNTPIIWKNKIRTELVVGGKTARSYNLKTGNELWKLFLGGDMCIPSPVADQERLYIGNEGRRNKGYFYAVKAGATGDITPAEGDSTGQWIEWATLEAGLGSGSPVLYNGKIYNITGRVGEFTCIDAANGELVYKQRIENVSATWASPWIMNDKIFILDDKGSVKVVKAGSEFELLHENKLNDTFWASAAFTKNEIILRGVEKLYCLRK